MNEDKITDKINYEEKTSSKDIHYSPIMPIGDIDELIFPDDEPYYISEINGKFFVTEE